MGHAGHKAQRTDSGTGGICRRLKLDLLAHARHLCRPALGTHGRGQWKLGLFADPYRYCNEKRAKKEIFTPDDLMFYNQQLEYKCEPGDFNIMVGPNSRDVQTLKFSLKLLLSGKTDNVV